jgi:transporter, CPA2 family (2.A.37)
MTPFLWALISNKYNSYELFLKLWRDENYNHGRLVSLVLGRVSVAIFFITTVVISYFDLNWGISVIIAIAVVALILILREDLTQYSRLETRFLANLNRREEAAKRRHPLKTSFNSEFNDKDLDLTSVVVSPHSNYIGKSLEELSFRQNFGVNVVAITRGNLNIYIPKSNECIYPQDKLIVVGTDKQLQKFRNKIEDTKSTPDTDEVNKRIALHSFTVEEEFRFLNKTIIQSHLGEKYDSIVVAIERNGELIPLDKDTTFQLGDLVWIVGNRERIRKILYP